MIVGLKIRRPEPMFLVSFGEPAPERAVGTSSPEA